MMEMFLVMDFETGKEATLAVSDDENVSPAGFRKCENINLKQSSETLQRSILLVFCVVQPNFALEWLFHS